jgi:hypothetical protein
MPSKQCRSSFETCHKFHTWSSNHDFFYFYS